MNSLLLAVLFIGGMIAFAVLGLTPARRVTHKVVGEGHNDVLVPLFLTAGVIYAVLLGFIVVGEWESYDAAKTNTAEEAALLVPLYRQTEVMAAGNGAKMREALRAYAEDVANGWPRFQEGKRNRRAGKDVNRIFAVFAALKPANKPREIIAAQFMTTFSQMILDRNRRYVQAADSLSWIMWVAAIGGAIVTVGMSLFLYMDRFWPQLVMVSVMSALIGMLLFTTALFSRPFVGPLAIDAGPFEQSISVFADVDRGF